MQFEQPFSYFADRRSGADVGDYLRGQVRIDIEEAADFGFDPESRRQERLLCSHQEVRIVDLQEGTFYADLIFDRDIKVSARPSDSVAIALRVGVPIYVEEAVLAEAGLLIPDENDDEATGAVREDEVEKFKEFLDSVSPDDFKAT